MLCKVEREQDEARAAKQGLWTDKNPVAPWEWRKMESSREGLHCAP